MRHYSKTWNSPENRKKRSDIARYAVSCRADRQPENREPVTVLPETRMTLTAENHITGKITVITFHEGSRSNNATLKVDGNKLGVYGYIAAYKKILFNIYQAIKCN